MTTTQSHNTYRAQVHLQVLWKPLLKPFIHIYTSRLKCLHLFQSTFPAILTTPFPHEVRYYLRLI